MFEKRKVGCRQKNTQQEYIETEKKRIIQLFEESCLKEIQVPSLLDASELLDLYGEDLRLRAYTTSDPVVGEQVLRPDFTLPILLYYLETEKREAKYFYCGNIWRRQKFSSIIPREQLQIGYEFFEKSGNEKVVRDVEAYLLAAKVLNKYRVKAVTGDIQILTSVINQLDTSEYKKNALMRHIWRPTRFKKLLEIFSDNVSNTHRNLFVDGFSKSAVEHKIDREGPIFGIRTKRDIVERTELLNNELFKNPIKKIDKLFVENVQKIHTSLSEASKELKSISRNAEEYKLAIENLDQRIDLLAEKNMKVEHIDFIATYGMTTLEYYDGFVFGFQGKNKNLPPVAQGGRYDGLCCSLAKNKKTIGAIGSMIRLDFLHKV